MSTTPQFDETCIGTSQSGMLTVYGRNAGELWTAICRTTSKCHAIDTAFDWGENFNDKINLDA